jgi:hypothetical protein
MRIRVIQTPTQRCIDGIQLDRFRPGVQYEVGNLVGALFLAEGWAEPVASDEPAVVTPLSKFDNNAAPPPNLTRDTFPPYFDHPPTMALDRRRHPRHRSS